MPLFLHHPASNQPNSQAVLSTALKKFLYPLKVHDFADFYLTLH